MARAARVWTAIVLAALSSAAARGEFTPERQYEEVMDPPTPVRGHAVVGAAIVPTVDSLKSQVLWVRAGKPEKGQRIRADLASANGRLRGEGIWRFDSLDGEPERTWYPLAIPPAGQRPDRPDHLAISVQPARSDPAAPPLYWLAALGPTKPADATHLRLYVNTRRAEMYVYLPDGKTAVRCTPIEGIQVVRFDAICDVELKIGSDSGSARLKLVRRDGHQTSPPQSVDIRW